MSNRKTDIQPIRFTLQGAVHDRADPVPDTYDSAKQGFALLSAAIRSHQSQQFGGASTGRDPAPLAAITADFLRLMQSLDAEYGAEGLLPVQDAGTAVDEALAATAELEPWLGRLELTDHLPALRAAQIAIGHWAMIHHLRITVIAPLVNALAEQANQADSRQENAAAFAMMQGLVEHLAPDFSADLERSNPERPWRLLNLNLAITGIRTGDATMIRYGFDRLDRHLPDECRGFYEEAHSIAVQPGFPAECRELIEAGYRRWTQPH
jgi:hypothetical protein